jgi:hypothetical protein
VSRDEQHDQRDDEAAQADQEAQPGVMVMHRAEDLDARIRDALVVEPSYRRGRVPDRGAESREEDQQGGPRTHASCPPRLRRDSKAFFVHGEVVRDARDFSIQGGLYATSDGGRSWHGRDIPGYREDEVRSISFLDDLHGVVLVRSTAEWLLGTSDGGRTWHRVDAFPPSAIG